MSSAGKKIALYSAFFNTKKPQTTVVWHRDF